MQFLVGVANPNLGEGEGVCGQDGTIRESEFLCSYRPSTVTFHLSLVFTRFRDIAGFVLQYATFLHPISSLSKISPCSPRSRWMTFGLWATKSEDVGLIVRTVSFRDFQLM